MTCILFFIFGDDCICQRRTIHFNKMLNVVFQIQDNNIHVGNTKFNCRFMVFNTTFNNISVILWLSVLLMEETCEIMGEGYGI